MKNKILLALSLAVLSLSSLNSALADDGSDEQIDLQWAICDDSGVTTAQRLGFEDLVPKVVEVTYYDTNPPQYIYLGASFRTKYGKLKSGLMSSVKLRSTARTQAAGADCEWDRYGMSETYTCEVVGEGVSPKQPWVAEQRAFISQRVSVDWSKLVAFGPYPDEAWKGTYKDYKLKLDAVNPPAPLRPLIELSARASYADREAAYAEITNFLQKRGVPLCPIQEMKTQRLFRDMGILR